MKFQVHPKVIKSYSTERIYVEFNEEPTDSVVIKIQPMEQYGIPHTEKFRIDEEERYLYVEMKKESGIKYSAEHTFIGEQRYSVRIKIGNSRPLEAYVYAVNEDYAALRPFKGDTHLHTNRSDGEGYPFEVACAYRRAGFDFIAVTDHHKMPPSKEARDAIGSLTSHFTVFVGEEVHNKSMGYFHVINFGGTESVNTLIETDDDYVTRGLAEIKNSTVFPPEVDADNCAYRIFIANEIRKKGGMAIMAHPYWDCYGEYNAQTEDVRFLLKGGYYDALEVLAGCDRTGNGNNLQAALWADLRAEGARIPVVGASDSHSTTNKHSLFNKQFSVVLAKDVDDVPNAIKNELSVAVNRRTGADFYCIGGFRAVKYVRFLMEEYYPEYEPLTAAHSEALARGRKDGVTEELRAAEKAIDEFNSRFFAV